MDSDYREAYRSFPTSSLLEIATSDTSKHPAEAIEAARAELDSRGVSYPLNAAAGLPSTGETTNAATMAVLTQSAQLYLDQTRPWVRFMSVFTFVGAAVMALAGLAMMVMGIAGGLAATGSTSPFRGVPGVVSGFLYLLMSCLYVAPGVFLHRYAGAIKKLMAARTASALEDALKHQKSFWRYVGILSIIALAFLVLVFVLGTVAGMIWFLSHARR
jgi:hypothetical protein